MVKSVADGDVGGGRSMMAIVFSWLTRFTEA